MDVYVKSSYQLRITLLFCTYFDIEDDQYDLVKTEKPIV